MLWISFALAIVRIGTAFSGVPPTPPSWTLDLHYSCISYLKNHEMNAVYAGLLCGESRLPTDLAVLFQRTGLYHLLVVSGSHFVFLEQFLDRLFKKTSNTKQFLIKCAVFVTFGAVCQFQPPVTRALISLSLQALSQRYKLYWRAEQLALFSGLWCLILCPQWVTSTSLMLSWLASLALTFSRREFYQHALIFLFLTPFFFGQSIYFIFNNLIAAPLFGLFFFPMTVVTAFIPYLGSWGNKIWTMTFQLMQLLPMDSSSMPGLSRTWPLFALWFYIFSLHVLKRWQMAR